jgi:hypothetical protein
MPVNVEIADSLRRDALADLAEQERLLDLQWIRLEGRSVRGRVEWLNERDRFEAELLVEVGLAGPELLAVVEAQCDRRVRQIPKLVRRRLERQGIRLRGTEEELGRLLAET